VLVQVVQVSQVVQRSVDAQVAQATLTDLTVTVEAVLTAEVVQAVPLVQVRPVVRLHELSHPLSDQAVSMLHQQEVQVLVEQVVHQQVMVV
jgi:hypothetical protein